MVLVVNGREGVWSRTRPRRALEHSGRSILANPNKHNAPIAVLVLCLAAGVVCVLIKMSAAVDAETKSGDAPTPDFAAFLRSSKDLFLKTTAAAPVIASVPGPVLHLVMGNEACDADSVVSALTMAYALHTQYGSASDAWVPLVAVPQADLALRPEVPYMLARAGIELDTLLHLDDVDFASLVRGQEEAQPLSWRLRITLVDHNKLAAQQTLLAPLVERIVDHHKNEQLYTETSAGRRTIQVVGSACTLVTEHMAQHTPSLFARPLASASPRSATADMTATPVAFLLSSVVLLDTHNMSPSLKKGTAQDQTALDTLFSAMQSAQDAAPQAVARDKGLDLFQQLLTRRSDTSSLSTVDLLRKDMKERRVVRQHSVGGPVSVLISSVPLRLEDWTQRDPELLDKCTAYARKQQHNAILVMTQFTGAAGTFSRQLLLMVPRALADTGTDTASQTELFTSLRARIESSELLQLQSLRVLDDGKKKGEEEEAAGAVKDKGTDLVQHTDDAWVVAYTQHKVTSSRKQLIPLVMELLSKL